MQIKRVLIIQVKKILSGLSGFGRLFRVIVQESNSLISVLVLFLIVLLIGSVAIYFAERNTQPEAFANLPTAVWTVVTLIITGYGDQIPVTALGRVLTGGMMLTWMAVFGLWTGILATAFNSEVKRENFLRVWDTVSKVPFFAEQSPKFIADVTQILRVLELPAHTNIFHKGQKADCMYFIASGEVEVDLIDHKVRLDRGKFFGEMALLSNTPRGADVSTTKHTKLLSLDIVDFRLLLAENPELAEAIDKEATRRLEENKG